MEEIFEQFKDKDAFDAYWKEHYKGSIRGFCKICG